MFVMPATKDHYATFERSATGYRVTHGDTEVARSDSAMLLTEHAHGNVYPTAIYLPADSLKVPRTKTELSTHCPLKGDASYWTVDGVENAIWSYETPDEGVTEVAGYIGFDTSKGFAVEKL